MPNEELVEAVRKVKASLGKDLEDYGIRMDRDPTNLWDIINVVFGAFDELEHFLEEGDNSGGNQEV